MLHILRLTNSMRPLEECTDQATSLMAFKTKSQAERLLVELTLLGLEPNINSAKNSSGNLWYRVRLGPFTTRGGMTAARSTIISNNLPLPKRCNIRIVILAKFKWHKPFTI